MTQTLTLDKRSHDTDTDTRMGTVPAPNGRMVNDVTSSRLRRPPGARPGRPATWARSSTAIRLLPELRGKVDAWAARQADEPNGSEAIRRLVELGLNAGK